MPKWSLSIEYAINDAYGPTLSQSKLQHGPIYCGTLKCANTRNPSAHVHTSKKTNTSYQHGCEIHIESTQICIVFPLNDYSGDYGIPLNHQGLWNSRCTSSSSLSNPSQLTLHVKWLTMSWCTIRLNGVKPHTT